MDSQLLTKHAPGQEVESGNKKKLHLWNICYRTPRRSVSAGNGRNVSFSKMRNGLPTAATLFVAGSLQSRPERVCASANRTLIGFPH